MVEKYLRVIVVAVTVLCAGVSVKAEVMCEAWVARYNGWAEGTDVVSAIAVDKGGNVYVTGYSFGYGSSYDYATIKYAPDGETLWVRRYNGTGDYKDSASALAVDNNGNVYVTGSSFGNNSSFSPDINFLYFI